MCPDTPEFFSSLPGFQGILEAAADKRSRLHRDECREFRMLVDAVLEYKVVGSCSGFGAEGSTEEARNVKPRATAQLA